MSFATPHWLWLLLACALSCWLLRHHRGSLLQGLAAAALVVALAGPHWPAQPRGTRVAITSLAADAAPPAAAAARATILAWRARAPVADRFVEVADAADPARALALAMAEVAQAEPGAILLCGDGRSLGADARELSAALALRGLPLHLRLTPATAPLRLLSVTHPPRASSRERIRLHAVVEAPAAQAALLRVRAGEQVLAQAPLQVPAGRSEHVLSVLPPRDGIAVLHTELVSGGQVDPARQAERTALLVEGPLPLLHLRSGTSPLAATLAPYGFAVRTLAPEALVADDLEQALVLLADDVPASAWSTELQQLARQQVLQHGLGLVLAGREQNLGPGGYADSPLRDLLPVDMPAREERRDPSVGLVIVLDTSGSMGGARIELAKEVARLAIQRLLPHDKVGIVEFYGSKRWAAPLQPAANAIEITRALNRLQAGGGTIIYAALEESYYALLTARTRFKHVLVLTDGGVEQGPFEQLARKMAESGIQVNTVLIGPQGNSPFLVNLAQWGRGRFYACPSRFQLPDLRFKEPQTSPLSAKSEAAQALSITPGFDLTQALGGDALPPVPGLVATKLRAGATAPLTTGEGTPLLAAWDQGLGRVLALASELLPGVGTWSADRRYAGFLADTLRSAARGREARLPRVVLQALPEALHLEVETAAWPVHVRVRGETSEYTQALVRLGPERCAAQIAWQGETPLQLALDVAGTSLGAAACPPLDRSLRARDAGAELAVLAQASGGTTAGELPADLAGTAPARQLPIARWFALAALLAFLAALLVRRWPVAARVAALAPFALLLCTQPVPAQESRASTRIQQELADKGHLDDLLAASKDDPELRFAALRADGQLQAALGVLPPTDPRRLELLLATGATEAAQALVAARLADPALPRAERVGLLLLRAELGGGAADFAAAAELGADPALSRRIGLLAAGYGCHELALRLCPAAGERAAIMHLRRASWCERLGQSAAAVAEYTQAYQTARLERDKLYALARNLLLHRDQGRLAELAAAWREPARTDPLLQRALLQALRELERVDEALALLAGAEGAAEQELALEIAVEAGRSDAAIASARTRLQRQPEDARLRAGLALLLVDQRQLAAAEAALADGLPGANARQLRILASAASELGLEATFRRCIDALRGAGGVEQDLEATLLEVAHARGHDRNQAAIELLLAARARFVGASAQVRLAEQFESLGRTQEALPLLTAAFAETKAEDVGLHLAWLLGESKDPSARQEALTIYRTLWLSAGSAARRVQAEERVLDAAAREGQLADLAVDLERELALPDCAHREQKRAALVKIYGRARDTVGAALALGKSEDKAQAVADKELMLRLYLENQEYRNYERTLHELIALAPEHELEWRQQLAMSALERGRPADAKKTLQELLARPDVPDFAQEFAAGVYQLAGKPLDAARVYRRSLARHSDRIETLLLLGNAWKAGGKTEQALGLFADLVGQDVPDDLFVVAADGLLNLDAPEPLLRHAERHTRRRLAERPDKVYLHRLLQDLLETSKRDAERRLALADTLPGAGEQRSAFVRELMTEAQALGDWQAMSSYGLCWLLLGDEAPPAVFLELGEALLKRKDFRAAERAFARARMAPDFAAIERKVAGLYEDAGAFADVERVWRRILRRAPEDGEAQLQLARLLERRGAFREAAPLYLGAVTALLDELLAQDARSGETGPDRSARINLLPRAGARKDNRGDLAWAGLLRCAQEAQDLQPLLAVLRTAATSGEPARRLAAVQRLFACARASADPALVAQARALEATLAASADPAVQRRIGKARLDRGELSAAAELIPAASTGFDRDLLSLALLRGDRDGAEALVARAGPADLHWATPALRAAGLPVPAPTPASRPARREADDATRLASALQGRTGSARVSQVLAVVRTSTSLDEETRKDALRKLLPDALADANGFQAQQLAEAGQGLLTAEESARLVRHALEHVAMPALLGMRLSLAGQLPAAERKSVLDAVLAKFSADERNQALLTALDRSIAACSEELQLDLIARLVYRRNAAQEQRQWAALCLSDRIQGPAAAALFAKLEAVAPEQPMTWALGALATREPAERQRRVARGFAALRELRTPDRNSLQAAHRLAASLDAAGRTRVANELAREPLLARVVSGDVSALAEATAAAWRQRPDDMMLLNDALAIERLLGRTERVAALLEEHANTAATVYPHYAGQLAEAWLQLGKPAAALATLQRTKDEYGSNLRIQLRVAAALPDPEQRVREARAWLQRRAQSGGRPLQIAVARTGSGGSLAAALRPGAADPGPLSEWDLLGTFAEGAELAQAALRTLPDAQRDDELALRRAWLAASRLRGAHAPLVRAAEATLATSPADRTALTTVLAAAQLDLPVDAALVERAIVQRLLADGASTRFLAEAALCAHARGGERMRDGLLAQLLSTRAVWGNTEMRPYALAVFALCARTPERLLALAPPADAIQPDLDGELLLSLAGTDLAAEKVHAAFARLDDWLTRTNVRFRRELVALPWAGVLLRTGRLEPALAALRTLDDAPGGSDSLLPQAFAAAIPPLAQWRDQGHVAQVQQHLREGLQALDLPRRFVYFRLQAMLAHRLAEDGQTEAAAALRTELQGVLAGPVADAWLR